MADDRPTPPSPAPLTTSADTVDAAQSTPQPRLAHSDPDHIGPYRVLERLGEGGMGVVYRAEQREPVRRLVALKVIKLGMDTREVVARFEAERQALATLSHPNVAKVFEAGATEAGRPYFAMEHVAGVPLTQYCDEAGLTTRQRLELFIPICHAVQHAHQKGIIHRDLKPTNILVTLVDGRPVPKVIDFGIAKATNQALTQLTLFTRTGALVGTPEYMSPEQAMTSGLDVDTRTDVYSLGVILYELLTGTLPLDPGTLRAAGLEGMARLIKTAEPQKPSTRLAALEATAQSKPTAGRTRDTRLLQKELRGDLDWVVLKAMEKDRSRRYDTANGLAADIARHLVNDPVTARPPSATYRTQKFVRRHRLSVLTGAVVLVALLAGLALATLGFVRARSDRDVADKARVEAQAERDAANKARIEAQVQTKVADDQRRLAVENARNAELQLAHGQLSQADALSLASRFYEAHQLYTEAYYKLARLKEPLVAAETGLWNSHYQSTSPLLSFTGHPGGVESVAIAPDGRTVVTGGSDKTLRVWDLATGRALHAFTGHAAQIWSVAIAPDGRTALSGSEDNTLKLWDLAGGKELRTLSGHTDWVTSVAIARAGNTALSGSRDGTLKVWDLVSGKELRTLTGHRMWVTSVSIAPDGATVLSGSGDGTIKYWDLAGGKELRTITAHPEWLTSVAIAPDGRTALSAAAENRLILWDLGTGKQVRTFTGRAGIVTSIAFSPDGRTALAGGVDRTLVLWDVASGKELRTFIGHGKGVSSVAFAPDGRTALSGSQDETLKLWDLAGGKERRAVAGHAGRVTCVAIAPDGRTALSGGEDKTLKLWDLASGKELRTFTGHAAQVNSVAVASDGRTALSGGVDAVLKLWNVDGGQEIRTFTGHDGPVNGVAIAPDGRTALSGGEDRTLRLWDLGSGRELRTLTGHAEAVSSVAFAPDGRTAISGGADRTVRQWDLSSGRELRAVRAGYTFSVAVAPDGRRALSGGVLLKLWDLDRGTELLDFTRQFNMVTGVAIAADGKTAVSGNRDHTVKLWDLASGNELRTFAGHTDWVTGVAISPDGTTVLSGSRDGTLRPRELARGTARHALEIRVTAAQLALQRSAADPHALATLGEWYAFQGMDHWAVDFLTRARDRGAAVSPVMLARCYWALGRSAEARREFQVALEQSADADEQTYLGWCIAAVDGEPQRSREAERPLDVRKQDAGGDT